MRKKIMAGLLSVGLLLSVGCGVTAESSDKKYEAQTVSVKTTRPGLYENMADFQEMMHEIYGDKFRVQIDTEDSWIILRAKDKQWIKAFDAAKEGHMDSIEATGHFFDSILLMSESLDLNFPGWGIFVYNSDGPLFYSAFMGVELHNAITD